MFKINTVRQFMSSLGILFIGLSWGSFALSKVQSEIGTDGSIKYIIDINREAQLFQSHAAPLRFQIPFEVTENLCQANYKKPVCYYQVDYSSDHLSVLWTKHPDSSKIGQILMAKVYSNENDPNEYFETKLDETLSSTFTDQFIGRKLDNRFSPDEIICDNYEWLGFNSNQSINNQFKLIIPSWHIENMVNNNQTGLTENRTAQSIENLEFIFDGNKLKLNHISKVIFSKFSISNTVILPGGPTAKVFLQTGPNLFCQLSLSQNLTTVVGAIDFEKPYNANPNYQLYKFLNSLIFKNFKKRFNFCFENEKVEFQ